MGNTVHEQILCKLDGVKHWSGLVSLPVGISIDDNNYTQLGEWPETDVPHICCEFHVLELVDSFCTNQL